MFVAGAGDASDASAGGRCWPRVDEVKDPQTGAVLTASDGLPLPSWYGAGVCHSWDGDGRECRAAADAVVAGTLAEVPRICNSKWCFVDPAACREAGVRFDYSASSAVPLASRLEWTVDSDADVPSVGSYGLGKAYSFETCGSVNDYTPRAILQFFIDRVLSGKLRVGFPGNDQAYLYNASTPVGAPRPVEENVGPYEGRSTDDVTTPVGGSAVEFYATNVADVLGLTDYPLDQLMVSSVEQGGFRKAISEGSLSLYPFSSYTACVADVGSNLLDLCLGAFWPTAERIAMPGVAFGIPFTTSTLVSVVRIGENVGSDIGWVATFVKPFSPFSADLWILIIALIIALAAVYYAVENPFDRMGFDEEAPWRVRMAESVFHGFSGAIGGEFNFSRARSPAGRLVLLSSGFFVVVITSSYTANLASELVSSTTDRGLLTVAKAIKSPNKPKICGYSALTSEMAGALNIQREQYVGLGDHLEILRGLKGIDEAGDPFPGGPLCELALLPLADWEGEAVLGNSGLTCGLTVSEASGLLEIPLAIPVRLDLMEAISWVTQSRRYSPKETSFDVLFAKRETELFDVLADVGHEPCSLGGVFAGAESRSQLQAVDFVGLALMLLTISIIASLVQSLPSCVEWWKSPGDVGSWSGVRYHDDFVRRENDLVFLRQRGQVKLRAAMEKVAAAREARQEARAERRRSTSSFLLPHSSSTGRKVTSTETHDAEAEEWKAIALATIGQQPAARAKEISRLTSKAAASSDSAAMQEAADIVADAVRAQTARAHQIQLARLNKDTDAMAEVVLQAFDTISSNTSRRASRDLSTAGLNPGSGQAPGWQTLRRSVARASASGRINSESIIRSGSRGGSASGSAGPVLLSKESSPAGGHGRTKSDHGAAQKPSDVQTAIPEGGSEDGLSVPEGASADGAGDEAGRGVE